VEQPVKPTSWRRVDRLPGYAPDLNSNEGVWNELKRIELANVCCSSLTQLRRTPARDCAVTAPSRRNSRVRQTMRLSG
jgi:transposase